MLANDGDAGRSISVILILIGCVILFTAEVTSLSIVGALLMAVGLWGLIR